MRKSELKKFIFIAISFIVIGVLLLILNIVQNSRSTKGFAQVQEDGMQVIELFAKNGYSPEIVEAKANIPTILRIKTDNTYDCSAAISIPGLHYSKFLPPSGNSDVQILPQKLGTEILGSCSMGMYGFKILFV